MIAYDALGHSIKNGILRHTNTAEEIAGWRAALVSMFNYLCFICKDVVSAHILINYLQDNMDFSLTCQEYDGYSLFSKSNEDVWMLVS